MFKISVCLLIASVLSPAWAAPSASSTTAATGQLALRFVPLDTALQSGADGLASVDLGVVSANTQGRHGRSITIRRRIAVLLDGGAGTSASARLSVVLATEMPDCVVRVDGLAVSTVPRLVAQAHRIGTPVVHDIEVTIPAHVAEGPFLSALQWIAESD
jgi:hypothetical protein